MRSLATESFEYTSCPACHALLIERHGYTILKNAINDDGYPTHQTPISGVSN